jgi:hypothetical protein
LNIDSGFKLNGAYSVTGHTFFDSGNNGGIYSPTVDLPYSGIPVYLYDASHTLIAATTTDASGAYTFTNLPGGGAGYTVSVDRNAPKLTDMALTADYPDVPGACGSCNNYNTFTISAADITDRDFGFYAALDFGDLPSSYNLTKLSDEGPRHVTSGLYLGAGVSTEGDGLESDTATGDALDDGVSRVMTNKWVPEATVSLVVSVTGSNGYLVGWIDWNANGAFDANEQITKGSIGAGSPQTWSFGVPSTYITGTTVNVRFRLYNGQPLQASPQGAAVGGEVEDYQWKFIDPTAVTLSELSAHASGSTALVLLSIFLIVTSAWFVAHRRLHRRTRAA